MLLKGCVVSLNWMHKQDGYGHKILAFANMQSEIPNGEDVHNLNLQITLYDERGIIGQLQTEIPRVWIR